MTNRVENLQYVLLPGHNDPAFFSTLRFGYQPHYENLYRAWKQVWEQTFKELGSSSVVENNEFLRHAVHSALFEGPEARAILSFSFFDLESIVHQDSKYFKAYPETTLRQLRSQNIQIVMTMEYLIIDPSFRKKLIGISLKDIICCLALKYFLNSDADAAIAVTRVDRSINEIFYKRNAKALVQGADLHNVKIDIIHFERQEDLPPTGEREDFYIDYFWSNRTDLTARAQHSNQELKSTGTQA